MANRIMRALIESTGSGGQPTQMPAQPVQQHPDQSTLQAPGNSFVERLMRGEEMPFDVGGGIKRVAPKFGIGADEYSAMAGSPQLGQRLKELVGDTMFHGAANTMDSVSQSTRKLILDGVATENTAPVVNQLVTTGARGTGALDVLRSFARNTTESDLINWFRSAELSEMGKLLQQTGDTRALDNIQSALRRLGQ